MADTFQPILSEPSGGGASQVETPGPGKGVASTAIDFLSGLVDERARRPLKEREDVNKAANLANLEQELQGELSLLTGLDVGGTVRDAADEMDTVRLSYAQGKMSRTMLNARMASIVQRYVSTDPRNSSSYRDLAKNVLGVVPTEQLYAEQRESLEEQTKREREVSAKLENFAIDEGVVVYNADGSLNREATAEAGRQLAAEQAEFNQINQKLDLQKKRMEIDAGRKLTEAEIKRTEEQTLFKGLNPIFNQKINGALNDIHAQAVIARKTGNTDLLKNLETRFAKLTSDWQATYSQAVINAAVSPSTAQSVAQQYQNRLDSVGNLFNGDFSLLESQKRIVGALENDATIETFEKFPLVAQLKDTLGAQAFAYIGQQTLANNPDVVANISKEMQAGLKTLTAENPTQRRDMMADMSAEDRNAAAKLNLKIIDGAVRDSRPMDMQTSSDFSRAMDVEAAAIEFSRNPESQRKGVDRITKPGVLNRLDEARNQGNAEAEFAGINIRDASIAAFYNGTRKNSAPSGATVVESSPFLTFGAAGPTSQTQVSNAAFQAVYNPEVGRVSLVKLSGAANAQPSPEATKQIEMLNQNLEAIVRLRDYGDNPLKDLNDKQIKQLFVDSAGTIGMINEESAAEYPASILEYLR